VFWWTPACRASSIWCRKDSTWPTWSQPIASSFIYSFVGRPVWWNTSERSAGHRTLHGERNRKVAASSRRVSIALPTIGQSFWGYLSINRQSWAQLPLSVEKSAVHWSHTYFSFLKCQIHGRRLIF
jgi:hypothetical protein